ncbi:MAG TPA: hypothetical protein VLH40_05560 [Atribacteraceae bacterium]|nr:hypothetical protein [Atribacteraceae bacterium]
MKTVPEFMNYSNLQEEKPLEIGVVSEREKHRIRELATRWAEIAASHEMKERKRLWKALKDLKPVRPMVLFETLSVAGFVTDQELQCENSLLRNVEKTMLYHIRQYEQLHDDIVLETYFRVAWKVTRSDYGVPIVEHHAENSLAYVSNFPIQHPEDYNKLKKRTYSVDRDQTLALKNLLEEIFGDILPVRLGNYDYFFPDLGFTPFTGNNFIGITMDLFKLMGNDNMLLWTYDRPDELHRFLRYLCDDRLTFYRWLKDEELLDFNTDNQFAGPSSYGYVSALPALDSKDQVDFKDVWAWPESQESTPLSPAMFDEFFLPYIAEVANLFGLTYYGCCEPVHDRIEHIIKALPNLRAVSVSGWSDLSKMAEVLGTQYVYSRKPTPAHISSKFPDWDAAEKDIRDTFNAARDCCLEFIVRDVYDVDGDLSRLRRWVDMARSILGI